MSRLVRLYPRAWRDRFEAEFLALVDDRPPSVLDRLDIVRGALDARIHPQVLQRVPDPREPQPPLPPASLAVIVAGVLWAIAGVWMVATPVSGLGYKDVNAPTLLVILGALVCGSGAFALGGRLGPARAIRLGAAILLAGGVVMFAPWPMLLIGALGIVVGAGVVSFAALAGHAHWSAGLLAAATVALPIFNTEDNRALVAVPFGLAWIAVGWAARGWRSDSRGKPVELAAGSAQRPDLDPAAPVRAARWPGFSAVAAGLLLLAGAVPEVQAQLAGGWPHPVHPSTPFVIIALPLLVAAYLDAYRRAARHAPELAFLGFGLVVVGGFGTSAGLIMVASGGEPEIAVMLAMALVGGAIVLAAVSTIASAMWTPVLLALAPLPLALFGPYWTIGISGLAALLVGVQAMAEGRRLRVAATGLE